MKIKNFFGHLHVVNKHRFKVFKFCVKAGIPFRGFVHDLSKYSPCEFFEGVKYFNGERSPISFCKKDIGYSKAWLHHKGRNKHHHEYWYDYGAPTQNPLIPYKYTVEMICDTLAAGQTYKGKEWTPNYQLEYFLARKDRTQINEINKKILIEVYEQVTRDGINKTLKKKNLKRIYNKYVNETIN